jgi:protein-S-isoprenylcysteine O-methyltransferase Ste14
MKPAIKDLIYISLQLLLFIAYLFRITTIDFQINLQLQYAGLVICIIGIVIIIVSFVKLNRNLTPFPSPKQNSSLITTGIYKYIRHPIYTGVLFATAGYAVYSENTLRLLIFIVLLLLFISKAAYEETLLLKKFPEYNCYKKQSAALLPGIY